MIARISGDCNPSCRGSAQGLEEELLIDGDGGEDARNVGTAEVVDLDGAVVEQRAAELGRHIAALTGGWMEEQRTARQAGAVCEHDVLESLVASLDADDGRLAHVDA